jgi:hypothetical protein
MRKLTVSKKVLIAEASRWGLEIMRHAKPDSPLRLAAAKLGARSEVLFLEHVPRELDRALKEDPEGWTDALKYFGFRAVNWLVTDVVAGANKRVIEAANGQG